jgi:uncharacterized protein (TIGR02118 family)
MVKLIIFFRKPADADAFEEHFANSHVPLINAMPNLRRAAVTRALGAPRGEPPYYLIHEVYFEDMPALNYALNSAEGRAAGADLMQFARDIVSLMFAEVWGEDPFELGLMGSEPMPAEEEPVAEPEPPSKSSLVPIDTSFLEKGSAVAATAAPVEAVTPATEPVADATAAAQVPLTESAVIESAQEATQPTETEAPATEAATEEPSVPQVPLTESAVIEASQEATPAQSLITESTATEAQSDAQAEKAEDATPSDTPAPADPRPQ